MNKLKSAVKKFWKDEDGVTIVAYALMAAIVAGIAVSVMWGTLQSAIGNAIDRVSNAINSTTG